MFGEMLLGLLGGGAQGVSDASALKQKQETAATQAKADFQKDLLKGVLLQSMKKGSKPLNYDHLFESMAGWLNPGFADNFSSFFDPSQKPNNYGVDQPTNPIKRDPVFKLPPPNNSNNPLPSPGGNPLPTPGGGGQPWFPSGSVSPQQTKQPTSPIASLGKLSDDDLRKMF